MSDNHQRGFTYLFVLLALTLLAGALLKSQEAKHVQHRQQQEAELLFRGEQIRQAISHYQSASYGNGCYPTTVEQLMVDRRGSHPHYHLRREFTDPLTGKPQWGMVYDTHGRWIGVHSLGTGRPLRKEGFRIQSDITKFKRARSYAEWVFSVTPDAGAPLPSACKGNSPRRNK